MSGYAPDGQCGDRFCVLVVQCCGACQRITLEDVADTAERFERIAASRRSGG